ncbi:MAG: Fic family protein [Acidobacteria bacterium]|nr:Fic family protein [Acidobacteriota bacterium]
MRWNWELPDWPDFRYEMRRLESREARFLHSAGLIAGLIRHLDAGAGEQLRIELLGDEAVQTSAIEGEILDRESVRSSLRRQLGLQTDGRPIPPAEQGIAEMMVDLYRTFDRPLDHPVLYRWHGMLMKGRQDIRIIGRYRTHKEPMQVISSRLDRLEVHFEAPPSTLVPDEMERFVGWFNRTGPGEATVLPPVTRAGMAHLRFVTLHPFEDGNGRIGRALAEKALSQAVGHPALLALADAIKRRQKEYYRALQAANRTNEITSWLEWFADTIVEAQRSTQDRVEFLIGKSKLLDRLRERLNPRQEKALLRMFEEGPGGFKGGMSAEKYIRITAASRATATRDLHDLVEKGALVRRGELKHTRYFLEVDPAVSSPDPVRDPGR